MEREKRGSREQAELILNWARFHIPNPCGGTPKEKAFMKRGHMDSIRGALEDSEARGTLTPEEEKELQNLLQE